MNEKKIWDYLISHGLTQEGNAGLMGNLFAESGLKPNNLQDSGNKKIGMTDEQYTAAVDNGIISGADFVNFITGYGLCQWTTNSRKKGLYDFKLQRDCSIADLTMQLDYLMYELTNSYKSVYNKLITTHNIREASDIVLTKFEMPRDQSESVKALRCSYSTAIYNRCATVQKAVLSGFSPDAAIKIAIEELGYMEKSKAAYQANPNIIYDKTGGAGSANICKYNIEMHKVNPTIIDLESPWCAAFISWVFYKAYGVAGKDLLAGQFEDYTVNACKAYEKQNAVFTTPKRGDQVFFTKNGKSNGCYHTGLVVEVTPTTFTTIEGNTSGAATVIANGGMVCKKTYQMSKYVGKVLFGRPKYDNSNNSIVEEITNNAVSVGRNVTTDFSDNFKVKVTAHSLRIRSGPSVEYSVTGYINDRGVYTIIETQNNWGRLKSGVGWISLNPDYIRRLD